MSQYQVEDKLNKVAAEVAAEFLAKQGTLEELGKKAVDKYMLNKHETETMCGKANHLVFKDMFAQDKLAAFDILKFDNILKVDKRMNVVEYKAAMYCGESFDKAAEDVGDPRNVDNVNLDPVRAALLTEAGEENIDAMRALRTDRSKEFDTIRNRVISLVKDGESLDDIYAVLRDSWGEENGDDLKMYFGDLVNDLKREGHIPKEKEFKHGANAEDVVETEPLKQASASLLKIAEETMVREAAHNIIVSKLADAGYDALVIGLDRKMPGDEYGVACALYKGAAEMNKEAAAPPVVQASGALRSALMGGAILGGGLAIMGGAASAVSAIRKKMWKDKLRDKYPELAQIPEDRYSDLYDSIVGLEPEMLRAPYALKEMIMAHNLYGTIDSQTILKLLESGRKSNPNMPLVAKAMTSGMALTPQYTFGH